MSYSISGKILNDKKMKVDLVYITDQCVDDYQNDKVRVMGRQQVYQTLWERIKKPAKGSKCKFKNSQDNHLSIKIVQSLRNICF